MVKSTEHSGYIGHSGHNLVRIIRITIVLALAIIICLLSLPGCGSLNPGAAKATPKAESASLKSIFEHVVQLESDLSEAKTEDEMRNKNVLAELELIKSRLQAIEAKLK